MNALTNTFETLVKIIQRSNVKLTKEEGKSISDCVEALAKWPEDSPLPKKDEDGWTLIGHAGVDSGTLMITDPSYIEEQWIDHDHEQKIGAPTFRHEDGTVLFCSRHGACDDASAVAFDHFDVVLPNYGQSVNSMLCSGEVLPTPAPEPTGEFSYAGARQAAGCHARGGQLNFKMGRAGAGVSFGAGFGDGCYPVYVRYHDDEDMGVRVAEARVVFIPDEQ